MYSNLCLVENKFRLSQTKQKQQKTHTFTRDIWKKLINYVSTSFAFKKKKINKWINKTYKNTQECLDDEKLYKKFTLFAHFVLFTRRK